MNILQWVTGTGILIVVIAVSFFAYKAIQAHQAMTKLQADIFKQQAEVVGEELERITAAAATSTEINTTDDAALDSRMCELGYYPDCK